MIRLSRIVISVIFFLIFTCPQPLQSSERRKPVMIEGKQFLPLRVLVRPFSNVYKEKSETGGTVMENLPAFQSFYVYTRPSVEEIEGEKGWYEVGSDNRGTVIGWMKSSDVFEWKQTMCLAYTHPEGRRPVLMFERKKDLSDLLKSPPEERVRATLALYKTIESGSIPPGFPVESVEPKKAIDISKEFYLLPILAFEPVELENREGRLLKLAAATGAAPDARESTDIRKNTEYLKKASQESLSATPDQIKQLKMDLVWVMDTTVSMKPHIEKSLEVVKSVSKEIARKAQVSDAIRFGFWGYRDSEKDIPGIGYTTQNYTPKLQPVDHFIQTLSGVRVTATDSIDWPEDVFSGVNDAVMKSSWTPEALRFIVLVGDAPGHPLSHPWNLSRLDEKTLREIANKENVFVYAIFIKDPRATKFYETGETQFRSLSMNKNAGEGSIYCDIDSKNVEQYESVTHSLVFAINKTISMAKQGELPEEIDKAKKEPVAGVVEKGKKLEGGTMAPKDIAAQGVPKSNLPEDKEWLGKSATQGKPGGEGADMPKYELLAYKMIRAALVEWVGSRTGAKAPRDILAYATDKDLVDPSFQSMDVRLLINKKQLASLALVLRDIIAAGRKGQLSGSDFFEVLQATAATAAREPDQIKNAKSLAQSGIVPEFLIGLPYKSQLMDITNELWYSWSRDEQDEFLRSVEAKIKAYQTIHDSPDGWIALNQGDDPGDYVYPISLTLLP
jgi:serine/threonine-protein kinase PpkA